MKSTKPASRTALLGLGLDHADGHRRITRGEGFLLAGGSQETHERMTETVLKTVESLAARGRRLPEADVREVADLLRQHRPAD